MKLVKRAAALVLCLCMLIGLPISVQAVNLNKGNGLELINAYAMSNRFVLDWTQGTGGSNKLTDHCVILYFNDNINDAWHIRNNNYVSLYIEPYKQDGTSLGLQNAGYQAVDYYGTTAGSGKKAVVIRFGTQNGSSFSASANGFSYWQGQGAVGFRLYMVDNKGTGINNKVDGWATSSSYGWCLKANAQYGGKDAVIKEILFEEDCLSVQSVVPISDSKLMVQFSEPVAMSSLMKNNGPLKLELHATTGTHLNANRQPSGSNLVASADTQTVNRSWQAQSASVVGNGQWIEVDFGGTAVADAKAYAKANNNGLFLHFADNSAATNPAWGGSGEQENNGLIDGIWAQSNNGPLLATTGKHRTDVAGDTYYCEIGEALTVSEAQIREDNTLLIKFSHPIAMPTTAVHVNLGLYNASNEKHADYDWSVSVSKDNASYYGGDNNALLVTVPSTFADSIRSIASGLTGYTLRMTLTSADGVVDGFISEITAKDNSALKLLAADGGAADAVSISVTCVETKLLKLESVDAFKEDSLVLTFNQDVVVSGGYYMGLTLVEDGSNCYHAYDAASGQYTIVKGNPNQTNYKVCQWNVTVKGYVSGQKNKVLVTVDSSQGNFSTSVSSGWNLTKIKAFCDQYSQGKLMFRIQENNGNNSGTIDCIYVDGDASNTLLSNFGNDQVHYEIADFRNDVIVESAKLIEGDLIEITFNKPITNTWYHATERGSVMLRLAQYNEATGLWSWYRYDGKDAGTKYSDTPTQWGWGLSSLYNYNPVDTPTDAIPENTEAAKVWYYKWKEGELDILDLLAMVEDPESVFAKDHVQLMLVLEKSGDADASLVNCVQNFTTADGKYYLYDNDALQWRHHAVITTELTLPSMVKITDVTVENENVMTVTFNKDIKSVSDVAASIVFKDANGVQKGKANLVIGAANGNTLTVNASTSTKEAYRNFSAMYQAAQENGWTMTFVLEQTSKDALSAVKRDGVVNGVIGVDGSYLLSTILREDAGEGYTVDVDRQNYAFDPTAFAVTAVKQVGKSVLIVEFSEDIELIDMNKAPFVGLRMVDPVDHATMRIKTDGTLTKSAQESKTVLQWPSKSIDFYGDRKDALVITFADTTDIGLLVNKTNMDAKFIPYEVMFCFEESNNGALTERVKGDYLMYHIRRENDAKQMESSLLRDTNAGLCDGMYQSITALDPQADLQIEKVEALDQTRIVITFSEAVTISNPGGWMRVVDVNLNTVKAADGTELKWSGQFTYYDEARTQIVFSLHNVKTGSADAMVNGLHELFGRGYNKNGNKLVLTIGDNPSKADMNGIVDSVVSTTGKTLHADPMTGQQDLVYLDVDLSKLPAVDLTITDVTVVSDIDVIVTFSAPVEIVDSPYFALRLMTEDNFLISISPEGEYARHEKGYTPMQWVASRWEWYNEEHTKIKMAIGNGPGNIGNFTDMMNMDFDSLFPGAHVTVGAEENNAAVIENNGRVDNIRLASDSRVRLLANSKLGSRDGCFVEPVYDYVPKTITAKATIINDLQIRVIFSEPVVMTGSPYIALRYIDEETNRVYYYGDEYNRTPVQFGGSMKWENDSQTSFIWTISSSSSFGACNLTDVINYKYALESMKGRKMQLCIEEKSSDEIKVGGNNMVIDNISSRDEKNHLSATVMGGNDGLYMDLNTSVLTDAVPITLVSAKAISDQKIELTFSEPIVLATENAPSFMLRYVSESGGADVLTNGKTANFKGDIAVKEGEPNVLVWTLNTKLADNLTDIFNYNGTFKWNKGSRVVFVIENSSEGIPAKSMRMWGITSIDGMRTLDAEYAQNPSYLLDVEIAYDIPAPEQDATNEDEAEIRYYSDYTFVILAGSTLIVAGLVVLLAVGMKRKKEVK